MALVNVRDNYINPESLYYNSSSRKWFEETVQCDQPGWSVIYFFLPLDMAVNEDNVNETVAQAIGIPTGMIAWSKVEPREHFNKITTKVRMVSRNSLVIGRQIFVHHLNPIADVYDVLSVPMMRIFRAHIAEPKLLKIKEALNKIGYLGRVTLSTETTEDIDISRLKNEKVNKGGIKNTKYIIELTEDDKPFKYVDPYSLMPRPRPRMTNH